MIPFGRAISRFNARSWSLPKRQQAHDDALAVGDRQGRQANVVVAARDLQSDPTVLRQPLLCDVETAHDLDARHDAGME